MGELAKADSVKATVSHGPDGRRYVYLAAGVSALGGMLFGYDIGVISGAILFVKEAFALTPGLEEVVVSSVLLESLLGAVVGGFLADRVGRRKLLIMTAAVFGLGAVGAALAPDTALLITARIIAGAAIGIASFVAPLYISEIAPVEIRGKLVSLNQLAVTVGIVVSYVADYALADAHAWRWMFALAAIPAVPSASACSSFRTVRAGWCRRAMPTKRSWSSNAFEPRTARRASSLKSRRARRSRRGAGRSCSARCCGRP